MPKMRQRARGIVWMGLVAFLLCAPLVLGIATSQIFSKNDTYADEFDPNSVHGSENDVWVEVGTPLAKYGYVKFTPKEDLPENIIIHDANISMYVSFVEAGEADDIDLHQTNPFWYETNLTWNNQPNFGEFITKTFVGGADENTYVTWDNANITRDINNSYYNGQDASFGIRPEDVGELYTFGAKESANDPYVNISFSYAPNLKDCPDDSIIEDGLGADISIDLFACHDDPDGSDTDSSFAIISQSNEELINCTISTDRYVTCFDPIANGYGQNDLIVEATDLDGYKDTDNMTIFVNSSNDAPVFVITTVDDSDSSNPTEQGTAVTFTATIDDIDSSMQLLICDSAGIVGVQCSTKEFCSTAFGINGSKSCSYNTENETFSSNSWKSYACDDEGTNSTCTTGATGTFNTNLRTKNPTLFVDGTIQAWQHEGFFKGKEQILNFAAELDQVLETCAADSEGFCTIDLNFSSETKGRLNLTNLSIYYLKFVDNETEGDTAIEEGIDSSLDPRNTTSEQQLYLRYLDDDQKQGLFDKVTASGSQRWAFNYNTTGETLTNMTSLDWRVNILEMVNRTHKNISREVSQFINDTKI